MRWVQDCRLYPARCAVMPQLGGTHPLGYIDSGWTNASGERMYVSVFAAQRMAESLGFVRSGDESPVRAENKRLTARVAELEQEAMALAEQLAAVGTLKLAGATVARPPGRPRKAAA